MKKLLLVMLLGFVFMGCTDKNGAKMGEMMRINAECIPCNAKKYSSIKMDELDDEKLMLKCCENPMDLGRGLKKVYIARLNELNAEQKFIVFASKDQKSAISINKNFGEMFKIFLEKELKSMGILVIWDNPSPYALKVELDLMEFKSEYFRQNSRLNSVLGANLRIKNINKKRSHKISVSQNAAFAQIENSADAEIYLNFLIKQLANKAALKIFDF